MAQVLAEIDTTLTLDAIRRAPEVHNQRTRSISVVVPVFNEEMNVEPLLRRLDQVLSCVSYRYEIIIVDDGSQDQTWAQISHAAHSNKRVKGIRLARNFGHQRALLAGLRHASGDAILTMDGDLQHPPELIPELLQRWEDGFDIVNTRRAETGTTGFFKRVSSKYFYRAFSFLSEVSLAEGSSDYRLISKRALGELLRFRDADLFFRGAVQWLGYAEATVPFTVGRRIAGTSKYGLAKMTRFASGAIVSFSTKPLELGIWAGLITSVLSFAQLIYIFVQFSLGRTVPGWASTVGIVSLLFGVLFLILGVIGIYLARVYKVLQNRPQFIVAETAQPLD